MAGPLAVTDEVRAGFSGQLLGPDDPTYDEARRIQNGLIDKRPALIARCTNTADVVDAVNLARDSGLELSVRGGGHNVAGKAVTDGGVMIDLSLMKGTHVDPRTGRARAQGGVTWREYNRATHAFGLASTGGVISTTGVAGLTLGGGLGWLMGKQGIAIDNLASVEIVTAEGRILTANDDENPDLYWAVRGGGGNFGVVTSFEFRTQPVSMILGGIVAHPLERATDVLTFYREFVQDNPDELTTFCGFVFAPDGSGHKIVALPACHCGDLDKAEVDVKPLRQFGPPAIDMLAPMPYPVVNTLLDEGFPKGALNYWKSAFFKELSDDAAGILAEQFAKTPSEMNGLVMEHFHGAVTRVAPTATAYPHREPGFNLVITGVWTDPKETDANINWVRETHAALGPHMADRVYVNYMGGDEAGRVREAYGPNYERLVDLKRRYDPENLFRLNQNIDPKG